MATEIFRWVPHLATCITSTRFNTLISTFENGMTQRRGRFGREIGVWKFIYKMSLMSKGDALRISDDILRFFKDRKGSYENFYLPSWEYECSYSSKTTANGKDTLHVTADSFLGGDLSKLGFSNVVGQQGNFIVVINRFGGGAEIAQIDSLGSNSITLKSTLSGTYNSKWYIMKAYKVYFEADEFERSWNTPYAWDKEITFVEDISSLDYVSSISGMTFDPFEYDPPPSGGTEGSGSAPSGGASGGTPSGSSPSGSYILNEELWFNELESSDFTGYDFPSGSTIQNIWFQED